MRIVVQPCQRPSADLLSQFGFMAKALCSVDPSERSHRSSGDLPLLMAPACIMMLGRALHEHGQRASRPVQCCHKFVDETGLLALTVAADAGRCVVCPGLRNSSLAVRVQARRVQNTCAACDLQVAHQQHHRPQTCRQWRPHVARRQLVALVSASLCLFPRACALGGQCPNAAEHALSTHLA